MNNTSATIEQKKIRLEQLRLLSGVFPSSVLASVLNGLLVAILLWPVVEDHVVIIWYFALMGTSAIRIIQYRQFSRLESFDLERDLKFWERSYYYGNALSGLVWGSSAFFLFPLESAYHQVFLVFVISGMAAGAVANLSYHLPSSLTFLILALIPFSLRFISTENELGYAIGFMTVIFMLILIATARRVHANIQQNVFLRLSATNREKELAHSQHILALHIQQSPIAIIDWDNELRVTEWNPSAERVFGYSREEALGKNMIELISSDDEKEKMLSETECLFSTKASRKQVFKNKCKDGSTIFCEWNCSLIEDQGDNIGVTSMVLDITEQHLSEEKIVTSEKRFRTLLDSNPDAIFFHDTHGEIMEVNKRAETTLGYSRDELLGLNVSDIETTINDELGLWDQLEIYQNASVEGVHRRKDGTTFPVEVSLTAFEFDEQKMILATTRDVTQRKIVEQMKNNFVSTVSHELRTPLTSIRGAIGLIEGGAAGEVSEKAHSLLEIAGNNVNRLLHLINDLLDMQKMEAGKMEFNMEEINVRELIKHAITENQPYARQFNITYEASPVPDITIKGDQQRLMQVMTNLLSNAAKFSPQNCTVEIQSSLRENKIRIEIVDHGIGIPSTFREHIFEKFSQADSSDTKQQQGTGLGLSIAREIILAHKGEINFTDTPEKGTTFYFDLPVLKD